MIRVITLLKALFKRSKCDINQAENKPKIDPDIYYNEKFKIWMIKPVKDP